LFCFFCPFWYVCMCTKYSKYPSYSFVFIFTFMYMYL
jgi:hypothetical protein